MFQITQHKSSIKKEVLGAITTFLTASYIIFVNPAIMHESGLNLQALVTATCFIAGVSTILLGLFTNYPIMIAPGMGLNAFFTFTLVKQAQIPLSVALGIVFISGICFFLLVYFNVTKWIIEAIPYSLKMAITGGIGLFLAFLGMKNLGVISANNATIVGLGQMNITVFIGILTLIFMIFLVSRNVPGGIFYGIVFGTALALLFHKIQLPLTFISKPPSLAPVFMKGDIRQALNFSYIGIIFSFIFVTLFDSTGTTIGCAYEANFVKKDGKIPKIKRILAIDAGMTAVGSCFGLSSLTPFVESATGIGVGARTGLTAIVIGALFLVAPVFTPIILMVPSYVTAPALIIVGILMFRSVQYINFESYEELTAAFFTIFLMPLTSNITMGISAGFTVYVLMKWFKNGLKEVSLTMSILGVLSCINLIIAFSIIK